MMGQLNMRDIPKPEKKQGDKFTFDGAPADYDTLAEEASSFSLKIPIKIEKLEHLPRGMRYKFGKWKGKDTRLVKIVGAAGEESIIPEQKLAVVTDCYTADTRKDYSTVALTDPVAAPAVAFSVGAHFEDGFDLEFRLASEFDPMQGRNLTPDESKLKLQTEAKDYLMILQKLITFKNDKNILQVAKDLQGVGLVQGKAAALIVPGISELQNGELPRLVEIITAEDLGDPIIDIGLTRQLVACKLNLDDKEIARADELVYMVRGLRGLRRESPFHGTSSFEPILIISKAIKRYYNLDAPLALIAAYITRQLIKVSADGDTEGLETRVTEFMTNLFKASNWATAMPEWYAGVDTIVPNVDWDMFDGVENKLANRILGQLQVPKSSQNREQDLNRDIATIQAIQFVRFTRKPAEKEVGAALENQLFNPLLSYLAGKPLSQIPVRIKIVRSLPDGKDIDQLYDTNTQNKNNEIIAGNLQQNQAQSPIMGASGAVHVKETKDGFIVTAIGTPASH